MKARDYYCTRCRAIKKIARSAHGKIKKIGDFEFKDEDKK